MRVSRSSATDAKYMCLAIKIVKKNEENRPVKQVTIDKSIT